MSRVEVLARTSPTRQFDGVPGLRNSQALHDWARATGDLEQAVADGVAPAVIAELREVVERAYHRVQALSVRRR